MQKVKVTIEIEDFFGSPVNISRTVDSPDDPLSIAVSEVLAAISGMASNDMPLHEVFGDLLEKSTLTDLQIADAFDHAIIQLLPRDEWPQWMKSRREAISKDRNA